MARWSKGCPDKRCIMSLRPVFCSKKNLVDHIRRKPMSRIIELGKEYAVCPNPETENYETLAELLADKMVVEQ